ncbi:golgin subfamily B member 1 isoform X4 [Zootoca vivipara]|uniref:golgin subfamily B member 1 isoform X4 n=1 Tax=Zootoca vivipara TaxID=8524 RepID=UPI00293C0100|nr:golgin subfamily B member 1 isoform X4 [Zootoca vivipara]
MLKWGSGDVSATKSGAHGPLQAANMSVTDLTEQLVQNEQLVAQLKELVRDKDNELCLKEQQLKAQKEASEAKISKLKLQNKAKVTSLTAQLEELKNQLSGDETQEGNSEQKRAASRGKILVLKKKVEELEAKNAQKNEALQKKIDELDAAHQRGAEMDAMLAEKQKKLMEKEAFIIDLQLACGSTDAKEVLIQNSELKNQLSTKEASLQSMKLMVQNLIKKVEDNEQRCSCLLEQNENLKSIQIKEREHFQEREAMYTQNIHVFQNMILEKEKELMGVAQKHEQELFKLVAKSDASADLEQLLKALKQKLHEKEEVLQGRTQVIFMLQKELDGKDKQLKEINEYLNHLQLEKNNLQSKLDAEKHIMRAQLRDMMEKHEIELRKVREKYDADMQEIREKHETELQEKDQTLIQLQKQLEQLSSSDKSNLDVVMKQTLENLEARVKLKSEEASKSEAKFLKMKALYKSRITKLEDELKNATSTNKSVTALHDRISELEQEKEELQSTLQAFSELKAQNEQLLDKLEVYEQQQQKLQADLEQVTKRAASQASESDSVDELQTQLLEWQEIVTESEDAHNQIREEKSAMALRMSQIEEEREGLIEDDWFFPGCSDPAIVSGQQELEEELAAGQGIGRMQPEGRMTAQSSRKLQDDYGFDGKHCYEELNITMDSTDSAEGENMGGWWPEYTSPSAGLRTVVEELELERNQLQEQILFLEERCRDLEDRLQLQSRLEALQNENDRLQSQLTQLRNQQARDAEKHQVLVSSLNEQLKGLNERNGLLETLLGEKEQKLSSTNEKLEQAEDMRKSIHERDLLNKELSEKLLQREQKLEDVLKKCSAYGEECAEQKAVITVLTEKITAFQEKTMKQDAAIELMQLDLEQTNEELDRLNTSHLEERSQLIHDLQRREREFDNLREVLAEKDKEISSITSNINVYSEQINILKCQIKCKEDEMRDMEEALSKAERGAQLLTDVQTEDVNNAGRKLSELSEQLSAIKSELAEVKIENMTKTKENEEFVRQIKETSQTVKDLHSAIKTRDVTYNNKLMECESQIKLLKEQISKSAKKLQETEIKCKEETDHLKSQIDEHISAKEKLNKLLKEKENKEQSFMSEMKSVKDSHNQLTLENAKKDEDLANLSRQLAEHTEHLEIVKKSLQEKAEIIICLKDKLKVAEQQNEKEKLKLVGELNTKEMQWRDVNNELHEKHEIINKMETERQTAIMTNKQLQAALEQKEKDFADQLKASENLRNEIHTLEKEKQQLISENESLSKLLDVKECELLMRAQSMAELESKMCANATEHQKMLSEVSHDKETLRRKVEELSGLVKQKENSIAEQLLGKEKQCGILADELSRSREITKELEKENQSYITQLKDEQQNKALLLSEYDKVVQQLSQEEEKTSSLQIQVKDLEKELKIKSRSIEEKTEHGDALLKQVKEKQAIVTVLEKEVEKLKCDNIKLSQQLEEKDYTLLLKGVEFEDLCRQISQKTEECTILNDQLALLVKEVDVLKHEKDSALAVCSAKSNECDAFQHQLTQHQSEIVSTKHEAHMLKLENEKLKADIEIASATLMKNCEGLVPLSAQLSQKTNNILVFMDQIDTLVSEMKTLKSSFCDKEALLSQREVLIQEMKENKDVGEKHNLQIISDLQSQVQVLDSEVSQLTQEVQEKENKLKKQDQELKLLKSKSDESNFLRVQLSENMEIISDLQSQLKNMIENNEVLNKSITEKNNFLKQKEKECVNLQTCISETSSVQHKLVQSLTSEAERLKAIILEKELAVNNISVINNELKAELQDKKNECETLKKQATNAEESNICLKKEISDQNKLINDISQVLAEKEASVLDPTNLVKTLRGELKINEEMSQLISQLHSQRNELNQENQKLKELAEEKENIFLTLQGKFDALYEQKNELSASLTKKEEIITGFLKDIGVQLAESNVQALTNDTELLRGELEKSAATIKKLLQEKDGSIASSQMKIDTLIVEIESAKSEHHKALEQVELWKQNIQERERALQVVQEKCTEQANHIEYLKSEVIEKLQQQIDSLINDKAILQENFDKLNLENKNLLKYQKNLEKKSKELKELHEKLEASENELQMHQDAVALQLANKKEQMQLQVSTKSEEVDELKFKVEKLEQNLLESENRWVAELARATQQNNVNLEQLSNLERNLKSKEDQIQSLHQEQDIIQTELSKHLSALSGSKYFLKDSDSDAGQQVAKTVLEKFSTVIDTIISKEAEAMALQQTILEREEEVHHLNNQLESMLSLKEEKELMQNDFKKAKAADQSEIEYLLNELSTAKDELCRQQSVCEEKDIALSNMRKDVVFLHEKIDKLEKELESSCKTLNSECQKAAKLLEEIEHKNQIIENFSSQTNQQKDLITSLSQQLKEKDCSVTQVMESMSNEMVKFSEEKNVLAIELQQLEAIRKSMTEEVSTLSQQVEEYKKELELSQVVLTNKEATIKDLVSEKAQLNITLEKINKEKENLKKKLQASLLVRKDLIQKNEKLNKKTEYFREQINDLVKQVENTEAHNKDLESQLEGLKTQLLEKDVKINDTSQTLSAKAEHLEQLEKAVTEFKATIAEQKSMSDKNLIYLQEKDCLLAQMQSVLNEREKIHREERSQLFLTIENLKGEIAKRDETFEKTNGSEATLNTESSCSNNTHQPNEINPVTELQKDKEILQKKLKALLVVRKESTKQIQKQKEEHAKLLRDFNELTKDFELIKKEKKALQEIHQRKCEEVDSNLLLLYSLQKRLDTDTSLRHSENAQQKTLESGELNVKGDVRVGKSGKMVSMMTMEESEMAKLHDNYARLMEEKEKLKEELKEKSLELGSVQQEAVKLKISVEQQEQQYKQERDNMLIEQGLLKQQLESHKNELQAVKTMVETMNNEKSKLHKQHEDHLSSLKETDKHPSEENKQLLMEFNMLREKVLPVSSAYKNVAGVREDTKTVWPHSDNVPENSVQGPDFCSSLDDVTYTERELLDVTNTGIKTSTERIGDQDPLPTEMSREQIEENVNGRSYQPQLQKYDAEEKNRERLQRKLQAALISRKEALKENKTLKDQMELLVLENKELISKVHTYGQLMSELDREKQNLSTALYKEETLVAENARLLIENENLTAACESLKSTMQTIGQEKEAFSFQLNSLKDSQTVELTGWKAKHSELKQEYESLLQAYENISSKIAEMRHIIDVTRKEKQEALHRVNERESDTHKLKELLQKAADESVQVKEQLKQLTESKQKEISELKIAAEKQASEHKLCLEDYQRKIDESVLQSKQLMEENKQLKEVSEILKQTLEKTEKENEELSKDFSLTKSALRDLQTRLELNKSDVQSKISDSLCERESLLKHIHLLNEGISEKEKSMLILKQENKTLLERLKDAEKSLHQNKSFLSKLENDCKNLNQEIVSLGERIKILEDDKCLLQEELENVQETSYKVKNEREFLETELLNHIKKLDQTTDRLKATQIQNSLLVEQLENLKAEKCNTIREKEEQQHLARVFEEKLKTAQRDNHETKNKTKELQELLRGKQQEINQLQKDSIKYQEMILDLEKSVKLSHSESEKIEKDLNSAEGKLAKSNEELQKLTEKLYLQNISLYESKSEIERLANDNLRSKNELKKKENRISNQKREYESQLEFSLQQGETQAAFPPGAPQEKAEVIDIDNMDFIEINGRLAQRQEPTLLELMGTLSEERNRREAAEEALGLLEEQIKRLELIDSRPASEQCAFQVEEEERQPFIINASELTVVRKVKRGAISFRRWIRGQRLCRSQLLTCRAKSRYLFLSYLVVLHLFVFLRLTGIL